MSEGKDYGRIKLVVFNVTKKFREFLMRREVDRISAYGKIRIVGLRFNG